MEVLGLLVEIRMVRQVVVVALLRSEITPLEQMLALAAQERQAQLVGLASLILAVAVVQ